MNAIRFFLRRMSDRPKLKVGVIGVPFEKGQTKYGTSIGPAAIRSAGLFRQLEEIDSLEVKDYGDINLPPPSPDVKTAVDNMTALPFVSSCNKELSQQVSKILRHGRIAITLGGDHSIAVGSIDGHIAMNPDLIVIWVDAHADLNTNLTSDSGNLHGMPVALLAKELKDYWPYLPTMDWQVPKFSVHSLAYIGLRSVDAYERLAIEKYNILAFGMDEIESHGIPSILDKILNKLDPERRRPIHVSFDIDSLDPLEAPSTGTPVRGGMTLREAMSLMELIHKTGNLRAVDLVEINPALGTDSDRSKTLEAGIMVLKAAMGASRKGRLPPGATDLPEPNGD